MTPAEIRAIRGSLSRAAFARILGVTALTVLRWELPEGNKEARRPRAAMIEALRRVAAEGAPASASPSNEDDEDDDDASEPASPLPQVQAWPADTARVQQLLDSFQRDGWTRAEDLLLTLLASGELESEVAHALATLGLVQAQLLRLDIRGALGAIIPILAAAERGSLSRQVRARAHVMAALAFSASDARTFDAGRVNAHAALADELLEADDHDARVMAAAARVAASRRLGARVMLRAYEAEKAVLARAVAPLARCMVEEVQARIAYDRGDLDAANRHGDAAVAFAERVGVEQTVQTVLADRAWRLLRAAVGPEAVLEVTRLVRQRARESGLATTVPFLRTLSYEAEALCRGGRYPEAFDALREALSTGKQAGLFRYAAATPAVHLYEYVDDPQELLGLADAFEKECAGMPHPNAALHAVFLRTVAANLKGEDARVVELAERIVSAPEGLPGVDEFIYDVWFELIIATMSLGDRAGWRDRINRFEAFLADHPSVWHTGILRRVEGFAYQLEGRIAEARQKQESTRSTFALTGDIAQIGFANLSLAVAARAAGAPDADRQLADALGALASMNVAPRKNLLAALQRAARAHHYVDQTMAERLVVAIERLALRGLTPDLAQRELRAVLSLLLPGHELTLLERPPLGDSVELVDNAGTHWHVQVKGSLAPEQQAALRVVSMVTTTTTGAFERSAPPGELEVDPRLPGFIAAAPATRRLKSEIAQLSRSSATILITGESGSGKEVVARAVHDLSARAERPFVAFNCASVPRDLFEGQLFGHRKGAFTGATSDSPGVIRAAHEGTLFLDEIGELPLDTQPKLLRFLENGEVFTLGEQRPRRVDVRVLAATHRDLGRLVREGKFREDLYYRLNVVPLRVPPLRERREDIVAIARTFLARLAGDSEQKPELGVEAVAALEQHTWPGNVRELRNVIERAMAYSPAPRVLNASHLRISKF